MGSKKRTIGILIVVIVVLGIVSGIFIFNNQRNHKSKEKSNYSEDVYSYVDDIIKNTVKSDNYLNADINEKYKIINKILCSLEKENKILSNSIEYDNENKMFWYNYSDGTEGGIMLENFSEGYSGNANIDDYVVRKDEQGKILSYNCDIDFNSNEYPYTEKEVERLDLKAKFMYGLGYDSILDSYKDYQTIWTKQHLKTDIDDYCTVEDFKNGLLGYNIVFIEEHGCYSNKKIMICTEELTSKKSDSNYKADLKDKRIKKVINAEDNKQYYWINPSFFSFYYKNNELSNTIIWIGSCHGYQCDDLVNVFSRCGAKAVIGYDESVLTGYDCCMLNPFVYSLFYDDSVSEALNFAKSVFGKNDLEYLRTYGGTKSKFGTIALMPSGKNNCATAKLYPGSENAKLIDSEIIGAIRGGEIKSKTQSTEFVEITEAETTEPITTTSTESVSTNQKEELTVVALSLGNGCSGCIDNNGNLYMWGDNSSGKLGNGTTNGSSTPIKIMDNVKEVNLGYYCSSAITEDGGLYMWGGTENSLIPVKIMDNVKTVSFGSEHIGAITKDGSLYMWGNNKHGKLGNGATNDSLTPVKIMDNVKSVSLSSEYSGAITEDGSLYMWGGNWCNQLGDGTRDDRLTPVKIMDNAKTVTLGSGHNAVITEDGSLYMWGYNDTGQVGNGTTAISPVPVESPVKIMENVKAVSLGSEHSGAITEDGSLYMWGNNFYNQLGYKTAKSSTPTKVMDNIKSISLVGSQSSAITEDNILYMWGRETNVAEDDVLSVSIGHFSYGDNHYGIIKTDGSLYMWGDNNFGEIGNGESGAYINISTPIKIEIK